MNQKQILNEAKSRSEKCTTQNKDIFRLAFIEGAEWMMQNILSASIEVKRRDDGTLSDEFVEQLCNLPCNVGILFLDPNDRSVHFLDPEIHSARNYDVLNDLDFVKEVFKVYLN